MNIKCCDDIHMAFIANEPVHPYFICYKCNKTLSLDESSKLVETLKSVTNEFYEFRRRVNINETYLKDEIKNTNRALDHYQQLEADIMASKFPKKAEQYYRFQIYPDNPIYRDGHDWMVVSRTGPDYCGKCGMNLNEYKLPDYPGKKCI